MGSEMCIRDSYLNMYLSFSDYGYLSNLGPHPCNQVNCGVGQECETDKQGRASCSCPEYCEPKVRPVCASDGSTYLNICEMNKEGCKKQKHLTVKYFGTCGKSHMAVTNL